MPAPFPTGMMRLSLVIQAPSTSLDSYGQSAATWSDVATLWGHVDGARTSEVMYEGGVATRSDFTFITGWYPGVGVTNRIKWVDNGLTRYFNISACWDRDQRQRRLQVEATEVLP